MINRLVSSLLLILFISTAALSQSKPPQPVETHKYRTILTISGAAGGFASGLFVGLSAFDDAVNSDRKVWTTSIVGAGAGAIGGYFIGRAIDHKRKKTTNMDIRVAPEVSRDSKAVRFAVRF